MVRTLFLLGIVSFGFIASTLIMYTLITPLEVDDIRSAGHLIVHEVLNKADQTSRPQLLHTLTPFLSTNVELLDQSALADHHHDTPNLVYMMQPSGLFGAQIFTRFTDGSGGLKIGPVTRLRPITLRKIPLGLMMGTIFSVMLIGWTTLNFSKITRISTALGAGDLSVRAGQTYGPAKNLVDAFNQMADRLELMVRERDELIQAVSHELGTPLSRLRFQLHLLDESLTEPASSILSGRIEGMQQQLDELDGLIGDAMIVVESNEAPLHLQEIDLISVIHHFGELITANDVESKLNVEVFIPDSVSLTVDPKSFGRVIDNLLRNASRYAKSKIEIRVEVVAHFVEISVEDDGPGIPKEDHEKVLKPFVRLEAHRGRETGGAGLGLAIVDRSLRRHRGEVHITQSHLGGAKLLARWPTQ